MNDFLGRASRRALRWFIATPWLINPALMLRRALFGPLGRGVVCVIRNGGDMLMVRHTYGDARWSFPGGVAKAYESPEGAVRREVREEVGVILPELEPIDDMTISRRHWRTTSMFRSVVGSRQFLIDGVEIAEARWFPIQRPPEMSEYGAAVYRRLCRYERIPADMPARREERPSGVY